MNVIDTQGLRELLARSTAIGTEFSEFLGEEMILWRSDSGEEFRTSYEDAAQYAPPSNP